MVPKKLVSTKLYAINKMELFLDADEYLSRSFKSEVRKIASVIVWI
jgi:hypothetical protein